MLARHRFFSKFAGAMLAEVYPWQPLFTDGADDAGSLAVYRLTRRARSTATATPKTVIRAMTRAKGARYANANAGLLHQ